MEIQAINKKSVSIFRPDICNEALSNHRPRSHIDTGALGALPVTSTPVPVSLVQVVRIMG